MKIRPLILGLTLTTAMLAAGCDNTDTANTDEMNSGMGGTEMNTTDMTPPTTADGTTMGTEVDDGVITTKVKTALLADDTVKGLDINVDTTQGAVRLSGVVDSQTQIDMAMQLAKNVDGVKDVQNELTVKN